MKISKSFKIYIHIFAIFFFAQQLFGETNYSKNMIVHKEPIEIKGIKFKDFNLNDTELTNKKGNIMILNFWATWCVPCKKELPDLQLLKSKLKNYKIDVLTISIDKKNIEDQLIFLSKNGASDLTHFFDKKMEVFKALKLRGIPTTIFVDKNGHIISKYEGILKWGEDKITNEIIELFN